MACRLTLLQGLGVAEPSRPAWVPLTVFWVGFCLISEGFSSRTAGESARGEGKAIAQSFPSPAWLLLPSGDHGLVFGESCAHDPMLPPGDPVATLCPAHSRPGSHGREASESASILALPLPTQHEGGSAKRLGLVQRRPAGRATLPPRCTPELLGQPAVPSCRAPSPPTARCAWMAPLPRPPPFPKTCGCCWWL